MPCLGPRLAVPRLFRGATGVNPEAGTIPALRAFHVKRLSERVKPNSPLANMLSRNALRNFRGGENLEAATAGSRLIYHAYRGAGRNP